MHIMDIIHDKKLKKFYCIVDGKECYAQYSVVDEKTLDFFHTFTPPELRGRGIAIKIFDEIKKYLEENHLKPKTSCSFAEKYLRFK